MIKFQHKNCPEYDFLSNFHPSSFKAWNNKTYATSEHFYQAMKATSEEDHEYVRQANSPGEAKRRGNKILLRTDWEQVKDNIMYRALCYKFYQNKELAEKLMATGTESLIEWAPWDEYWGEGKEGKGQNMLGKLLEKLRTELKEGGNKWDQ